MTGDAGPPVPTSDQILATPPDGDSMSLDQDVGIVVADWPSGGAGRIGTWLLSAIGACKDPSAFERIVELLAARADIGSELGVALIDVLLSRVQPTADPAAAYIASSALEDVAARLLVQDIDGRRLDLVLRLRDGAALDTDAAWAQAVAGVSGLLHAHWTEDSLRGPLRSAVRDLHDHPAAGADADVEGAHMALLDAVEASDESALRTGLADAEERFSSVSSLEEDRVDAAFFAAVVRAVRAFGMGGEDTAIAEAAERARDIGVERALYGREDALPAFSRRNEEAMWGRLTDTLGELSADMDQDVWIHGARTVNLMAGAIQASRCVRLVDQRAVDASRIVVPPIEARLVRGMEQRRILQEALRGGEIDAALRDEAVALLDRVTADPKADGPEDALEDVFGADLARRLTDTADPAVLEDLVARLRLAPGRTRDRDSQWHETYNSLLEGLAGHPDYEGRHRQKINGVVADLLDFCSFCIRHEIKFADGAFAYLADPNAYEAAMADHLVMYLHQAGWTAQAEVPNEGSGGRLDVRVSLDIADRFVIECKRDKQPVAATTIDPYLAQADRYLTSSLRIGALAILDLTDKTTGSVRGLDTSAWINEVPAADPAGPVRRIITVVIPGNRAATPSQVGKATSS